MAVTRALTVSIDAMGGDAGPSVVVSALLKTIQRHTDVNFILHGDEALLNPLLARQPKLKGRATIRHAPGRVAMEDKPSHVLRRGKNTSMWHTIECVKAGEADVAISAGNTGALMAVSMFGLGIIEGISRPAIAVIWPTLKGQCVVLDVGANVGATEEQLVDFAVMGEAF
ncbi:MAG TPA: phosphate acyltransferase, partial [Rhizomicrobium sp.]|nr:phosphate acyltransferase [Rhizomicrobium sp.]